MKWLELERSTHAEATGTAVESRISGPGRPRIAKPSKGAELPGIVHEWIDTSEVRVVEDVLGAGAELKRAVLAEFHAFEHR
jgi:hypothetical protein